jgi:hypothetical protein
VGQIVLSRPSADSFAVGRRQKSKNIAQFQEYGTLPPEPVTLVRVDSLFPLALVFTFPF